MSEKVEKIITWIGLISEEVIDEIGPFFAKVLLKLLDAMRNILAFLSVIHKCPLSIAITGIVSMLFIINGFGALGTAAALIPAVGVGLAIGVGIVGGLVLGEVTGAFRKKCE